MLCSVCPTFRHPSNLFSHFSIDLPWTKLVVHPCHLSVSCVKLDGFHLTWRPQWWILHSILNHFYLSFVRCNSFQGSVFFVFCISWDWVKMISIFLSIRLPPPDHQLSGISTFDCICPFISLFYIYCTPKSYHLTFMFMYLWTHTCILVGVNHLTFMGRWGRGEFDLHWISFLWMDVFMGFELENLALCCVHPFACRVTIPLSPPAPSKS